MYTTVPRYSDNYVYEKSAYTDSDGILFVNNPDIRGFRPVAENDSLYPITRITVGNKENIPTEGDDIQTVFFTDRLVYRPGDTLRFAGVIFSREISRSKAIAGEEQNITLYGVNGKIAYLPITLSYPKKLRDISGSKGTTVLKAHKSPNTKKPHSKYPSTITVHPISPATLLYYQDMLQDMPEMPLHMPP